MTRDEAEFVAGLVKEELMDGWDLSAIGNLTVSIEPDIYVPNEADGWYVRIDKTEKD